MTDDLREKLSKAGTEFDGHVTNGSLLEQEKIVDQMIDDFVSDLRMIGSQCLAGGHKMRNRMFQALANRYERRYKTK